MMNNDYRTYLESLNIGALKSKQAWLGSELKTTDIMTALRHHYTGEKSNSTSNDAFDVLYLVISKRIHVLGVLVVLHISEKKMEQYFSENVLVGRETTFTQLKVQRKSIWVSRCYAEPNEKILLSNGKALKLWERPYILKATTDYDKDFRKEWQDGELVYEGNNWGDSSTFYIVGCLDM